MVLKSTTGQSRHIRSITMDGMIEYFWIGIILRCAIGLLVIGGPWLPFPPAVAAQETGIATDFDRLPPGGFTKLETAVGTLTRTQGLVRIDDQHAKSGEQCLQIAGDNAQVEWTLAQKIDPEMQLSFWAERWTARAPFRFRIEKYSSGKWSEIFNGDKQVRVGRAFLSHVRISLTDSRISKIRFTVNSPPNTGVLIDDLRIAPAQPMKVTAVEAVPWTLPALVGVEASALVKVKITTTGVGNPIAISSLKAELIGDAPRDNLQWFQPVFTGTNADFRMNEAIGNPWSPSKNTPHTFAGSQMLSEGENYLWLTGRLKSDADIDQVLSARIISIEFSNGESWDVDASPTVQRLGIAVRAAGDDGVPAYRIPGLATSNRGTLIAVYDVRRDGGRDLPGNIDVGMSRSTNGGRDWEPMKIIMDMGDDPKWRGDGIGDPAVLVDANTGTIWVSATWSHGNRSWHGSGPGWEPDETGQWMLVKSMDDGRTWSPPINITRQVKRPEWSFLLQGPGKGITMSDGTLVFAAQYQDPPNDNDRSAHRLPHSTLIYSRDHGQTWAVGSAAWDDTTESQLVELADHQLMINCRTNRSNRRAVLVSNDLGKTWQPHATHLEALIEPGACMASLINVGRELGWRRIDSEFDENLLLFSNPNSLRGRSHITIKASTDAGSSWPVEYQVLLDQQTGRGYSCLSMIDAETVGILYEGSQADLTFQRIKLDEIVTGKRDN